MAATRVEPAAVDVAVSQLPAIGKVDERFLSYNVESVEVTGGNFWAPYPKPGDAPQKPVEGPHGAEFATDAYEKRDPINLNNQRLRILAQALAPSYMRISGSWANSIYFQDDDEPTKAPPSGYQGVMTRAQWAGVVDFAKAVDAKILTSFATSDGARRADGSWNPDNARSLFAYTRALGREIDAVELMNEPNANRVPYAPDAYARDHAALGALVQQVSPRTKIVGPSSTGEAGFKLFAVPPEEMSTARLLSGTPQPHFDVFSHHFYGAVSQRCKSLSKRRGGAEVTTSTADALSESWLARADQAQNFYKGMRDRFAPAASIWITETAQTACGGDPWSATFLDTFRFVDQLGRLAKNEVSVIFHNTLAASDYAFIDDKTWQPRPNYWAALLWRRLMGQVVLDSGTNRGDLHLYAHCLRNQPGGVALVAINLNKSEEARLNLPVKARSYVLTAATLETTSVNLNGRPLVLTKSEQVPKLSSKASRKGAVELEPASITFFEVPQAGNTACH